MECRRGIRNKLYGVRVALLGSLVEIPSQSGTMTHIDDVASSPMAEEN